MEVYKLGTSNTFGLWKKLTKIKDSFDKYFSWAWILFWCYPIPSLGRFPLKLCHSLSWLCWQNKALLCKMMPATQATTLYFTSACQVSSSPGEGEPCIRCKRVALLFLCSHVNVFETVLFLFFIFFSIRLFVTTICRMNYMFLILQESTH